MGTPREAKTARPLEDGANGIATQGQIAILPPRVEAAADGQPSAALLRAPLRQPLGDARQLGDQFNGMAARLGTDGATNSPRDRAGTPSVGKAAQHGGGQIRKAGAPLPILSPLGSPGVS
jgi:hypothetical protein